MRDRPFSKAQETRRTQHTRSAQAAYQQLPQQFMDATVDLSGVRAKYFQQLKQAEVSLANRNPTVAGADPGSA